MLAKKSTVGVRLLFQWKVMRFDLPHTDLNDTKADLGGTDAVVYPGPWDAGLLPELKPFRMRYR
jgi:hypothetical protein